MREAASLERDSDESPGLESGELRASRTVLEPTRNPTQSE
jgi:hypothetical protein